MTGVAGGPSPPAASAAPSAPGALSAPAQPQQAATKPGRNQIKPLYALVDATHNYPAIYRALKGSLQDKFTVYNRGRDQLQIQTASVPEYQLTIRALQAIGAQFSVLLQKDEIPSKFVFRGVHRETPAEFLAETFQDMRLPVQSFWFLENRYRHPEGPNQCSNCQRFSHVGKGCNSKSVCHWCSGPHRAPDCPHGGSRKYRQHKHRPSHKAPQASNLATRASTRAHRHHPTLPLGPPCAHPTGAIRPPTSTKQFQGQPAPHFKKHPSGHKNGKGAARKPRDTPAPPAPQTPAQPRSEPQKAPPAQPQQASPAPADTMAVDAAPGTSSSPQPTPAPTLKKQVLEDFLQVLEKSETFKSDPNLAATIMPMMSTVQRDNSTEIQMEGINVPLPSEDEAEMSSDDGFITVSSKKSQQAGSSSYQPQPPRQVWRGPSCPAPQQWQRPNQYSVLDDRYELEYPVVANSWRPRGQPQPQRAPKKHHSGHKNGKGKRAPEEQPAPRQEL
ncbi:neurofilament heavy polypeptide-like [Bacillus rossius redtenbacheri]|uniref:neurofilament heavy polypeptide-like n=1 Tax=Bacillus rossius redtenbacheri TaxID=93214 RepID=UPI002FDE2AF4